MSTKIDIGGVFCAVYLVFETTIVSVKTVQEVAMKLLAHWLVGHFDLPDSQAGFGVDSFIITVPDVSHASYSRFSYAMMACGLINRWDDRDGIIAALKKFGFVACGGGPDGHEDFSIERSKVQKAL